MSTRIDEIADGIYRISTYVEPADFTFNQYLVRADEPLLFHCGLRGLFPAVSEAVASVMPLATLRWISFGHYEADECGAMNQWLAAAPQSTVAFGAVGCMTSVGDMADRAPRPLDDGDTIDLGDRRLRYLATPHVPHGWDAGLLFDERTKTLLCGDLFTAIGRFDPLTEADLVGPAMAAEQAFQATALTPRTGPTIRRLAQLEPETLALMHGPAYRGDCTSALETLAGEYEAAFREQSEAP